MLENRIQELKNDADKYARDAENISKKEGMKILLSKSDSKFQNFEKLQRRKMKLTKSMSIYIRGTI